MFFEIAKTKNSGFPANYLLKKGIYLNSDLGWQTYTLNSNTIFFKGYVLDNINLQNFLENIIKDPVPRYDGNFICIIVGEKITITNDKCRGTPLQYDPFNKVTNLEKNLTPVWSNNYLTITENFNIKQIKFTPYSASYQEIDYNASLNEIDKIICNSFEIFLSKNTKPIKIFLSGGIDTLTMYSYLKKFTKKFEIVDYEYFKFTHFYTKNLEKIKKFWGYNQMHSWGELPVVFFTGACGDEFFLRGPAMLSVLADFHEIDVLTLLDNNRQCYHHNYFFIKNQHYFKQNTKRKFSIKKVTIDHILNNLINDHQHWHIDETICFTPFKNITIPNIICNLPKKNIVEQILHAQFNKDLIIKNDSDDLKLLSKQKNFFQFENLINAENNK